MINEVYQLIAPKLIDTAYKEIDLSKNEVILRPVKMSICCLLYTSDAADD